MNTLQEVFQEWQTNPHFRKHFKENPELALKQQGFELSQADLSKVKAMLTINKADDDKLDDRISK